MYLIDKINENCNKFNIKFILESATYNKRLKTLLLQLIYPDGTFMTLDIEQAVKFVVADELPNGIKNIEIKYKKNYYDNQMIANAVIDILKIEVPLVEIGLTDIYLNKQNNNTIQIDIQDKYAGVINKEQIIFSINNKLKSLFFDDFNLEIVFVPSRVQDLISEKEFDDINEGMPSIYYEVNNKEVLIGDLIQEQACVIAMLARPTDDAIISGKIIDLKEQKTKPKQNEDGTEKPEKIYYTFNIKDYTGQIRCVYFPSKINLPKFKELKDDMQVCVCGNIEEDGFNGGLTMRPKHINICELQDGFFDKVYSKPIPKNYRYVYPQSYIKTTQSNLFAQEEQITDEYLLNNTFVVFDLETTGFAPDRDRIIEIGAVKIENGKMTQTFECLVDPEMHIPESASKVNHITDSMVEGQLKIEQVLPDFLKFCEDSIVISYNISFDMSFILHNAKMQGYAVLNETQDALAMARDKIKGLRNYKLGTVVKEMGIELENAHRAIFDTIATTELVIKMLQMH